MEFKLPEREQFSNNAQINIHKFDKNNILKKWIDLIENV